MLKRRTKPENILAEGGMLDDSGEVVNGTQVPAGSLAEEVADDVPAMLSEGEFVVPADVVRFVGLERLMKMRDKAKEGLERMEEMGQMGNAEEVSNPDQQFSQVDDIAFENDIDSIMSEVDRDSAGMQTQQMFAAGGFVTGTDLSKATENPAVDVRYYRHNDGRVMYITHINDKPMTAVPDGFKEVSPEEARQVGKKAEETAAAAGGATGAIGGDGGGDATGGPTGGTSSGVGIGPTGLAATGLGLMAAGEQLSKVPTATGKVAGKAATVAGQAFADKAISQTTSGFEAMQAAASVPGIMSVSGPQGQVTTVSTPASIAAADQAMFGLDPSVTGMSTNAQGRSVSDNASIAAQNAAMGAISTGSGLGDLSEAASTGMTTVGGQTISNADTIAAQNEAIFGGSSSTTNDSSGWGGYSPDAPGQEGFDGSPSSDSSSGGGNDGTYCCSRMVDLGIWSEYKELARMHVWHHKQPKWWRAGYSIWGKVVADTLFKKEGFWTDVMKEFYDYHVKKKPRTLKSTVGDIVIYPGVAISSLFVREVPATTRYVRQ